MDDDLGALRAQHPRRFGDVEVPLDEAGEDPNVGRRHRQDRSRAKRGLVFFDHCVEWSGAFGAERLRLWRAKYQSAGTENEAGMEEATGKLARFFLSGR